MKQVVTDQTADAVQGFALGLVSHYAGERISKELPHFFQCLDRHGLGPHSLDVAADDIHLGASDAWVLDLTGETDSWRTFKTRLANLWLHVKHERVGHVAHTAVRSDLEGVRLSVSWGWDALWAVAPNSYHYPDEGGIKRAHEGKPLAYVFKTKGGGTRISFGFGLSDEDIEALPPGLRREDDWYGNFAVGVLVSRESRDTQEVCRLINDFLEARQSVCLPECG